MAYEMAYTDERLTEHTASVWLPMYVGFDHGPKSGRVVFNGYSNIAALAANAPVVGQKAYELSGENYGELVSICTARLLLRLMGQPDTITAEGVVDPVTGVIDPVAETAACTAALNAIPKENLVAALCACPMLGLVSEAVYCWAEKTKDKDGPVVDGETTKVSYFDGATPFTIPM